MSKTLSDSARTQFEQEVKHAYQQAGLLRPTVRVKTGVIGSTVKFPKMGKGKAHRRGAPAADVVPMGVVHTQATATISDWEAPEYTDLFDQQKVNFDERKELAETIAGAMGRCEDQLIIDALDAASTTLIVSTDIGGSGTGLNPAKLRETAKKLKAKGVKKGNLAFVGHTNNLAQMLGETEATSADFNTVKALVNGEINEWMGFKFVWIEDRDEDGLDLTSSVRQCFAYDKMAMGLAVGIERKVEVNYIPHKTAWLSNGIYGAGSTAVDANGIVEIACTES